MIENIEEQSSSLADIAGFEKTTTVGDVVAAGIKGFLALLGVIFIIIIIVAGHKWMTAGGNEDKVKDARTMISRAIIGLLIIIAAYAITHFVFKYLPWGGTGAMG